MANETITLSKWVENIKYEDLPIGIVKRFKNLVLDGFGVGLFGSKIPVTLMVADVVEEWGGKEESTIWGRKSKVPCANAAFVNGVAIESFEMDDMGPASHTECSTLSSGLAVSERKGDISGKDFLTAVVAGFEVAARVRQSSIRIGPGEKPIQIATPTKVGWHGLSYVWGAATTAGKILGLDAEQMAHNFSMAASQASGLYHCTMVKRIHPGWGAHAGVISALLIEKGLGGVIDILERKYGGWYSTFAMGFDPEKLVGGLGKKYLTAVQGFKYFSGSTHTHTAIQCVEELKKNYPILYEQPDMIKKIILHVSDISWRWSGLNTDATEPWEINEPNRAMMDIRYVTAVRLLMDGPWLPWGQNPYTEKWISNPKVQELIEKSYYRIDLDEKYLRDGIIIEILMKDDKSYSYGLPYPRGGSGQLWNPMTPDEVVQKFKNLAIQVIDKEKAEEIIKKVDRIEEVEDVAIIAELLKA